MSNSEQSSASPNSTSIPSTEKCPIDHTKISKSTWLELGQSLRNPLENVSTPTTRSASDKEESCPVDRFKSDVENKKTILHSMPFDSTSSSNSTNQTKNPTSSIPNIEKCPIDHTNASKSTWLELGQGLKNTHENNTSSSKNIHSDKKDIEAAGQSKFDIDPRNLMPRDVAFNKPNEKQSKNLEQVRQVSTIPKKDDSAKESHWVYPSEQMFYNAMKRKNWNPSEEDMKVLVPIHNAVNERAWHMILRYEEMYKSTCGDPKLVKFEGKPKDITPKARFKNLFGYSLPFDRHDWTVDRCGQQVRYIIDFYAGKSSPLQPDVPSFYLDVRPDISPQGLVDRFKYFFRNFSSGSH